MKINEEKRRLANESTRNNQSTDSLRVGELGANPKWSRLDLRFSSSQNQFYDTLQLNEIQNQFDLEMLIIGVDF